MYGLAVPDYGIYGIYGILGYPKREPRPIHDRRVLNNQFLNLGGMGFVVTFPGGFRDLPNCSTFLMPASPAVESMRRERSANALS